MYHEKIWLLVYGAGLSHHAFNRSKTMGALFAPSTLAFHCFEEKQTL
jgi:hypothetical protein